MSRRLDPWKLLLALTALFTVLNTGALVLLWVVDLAPPFVEPAVWSSQVSTPKGAAPKEVDPQDLLAGYRSMDAMMNARLEQEAASRGLSAQALRPPRALSDAVTGDTPPTQEAVDAWLAGWSTALKAAGVELIPPPPG